MRNVEYKWVQDFLGTLEFAEYRDRMLKESHALINKEQEHELSRFWMSFKEMSELLLNTVFATRTGN